ncbi:hypothetical protein Taro_011365 [Colocasia esculenta]|uniref:Sialate O-acetylesterase domain-containing protein n=1 Tax=Colocasia esculenta TaxID=4460 RepID=A0A843UCF3_COLES|nr:hypothetical protein [Colocasia esculenta]
MLAAIGFDISMPRAAEKSHVTPRGRHRPRLPHMLRPPRFSALALTLHILALSVRPSLPSPDGSAPSPPTLSARSKLVFILAGQSNMAGRGGVVNGTWDGVVPRECRPNPSIQRLTADLRWVEARDPLHADIDVNKTCGVGPGMPFARSIRSWLRRSAEPVDVGLVPCAIGGTGIDLWGKGTQLYEQMVRRARAAARGACGGVIQALLWYQGESDTETQAAAESYRAKMERLICDVRADLGLPELLVIQVLLASGQGRFLETVREAQRGVRLPNVAWVDAKGLPLEADQLHLSTPGEVMLGEMLAAAYRRHSEGITNTAALS